MNTAPQRKKCATPNPIRWDAHGCPPFKIGADLSFLKRYKNSGVNFISLNVGFDLTTKTETLQLINYFRQWIHKHNEDYVIIENVQALLKCQTKNKLGIAFDLEGCNLLDGQLDRVSEFYSLGVRQMVFAYNTNNLSGGGCFDIDTGLTSFGKQLVKECNRVGMVIDCSHVGYQTSLDIINLSEHPVVFSHSNPATLVQHPRNITDAQIIACAAKGGVIGINGIGLFLGNNELLAEKIVEHIDYVASLVGAQHVGIGLDCVFDENEVQDFVKNNPSTFQPKYGFTNDVVVAEPEQFSTIAELLALRDYCESDINHILGENFLRVAKAVWR